MAESGAGAAATATGAGYKLVRNDYTSLVGMGKHCYMPGTTHWIEFPPGGVYVNGQHHAWLPPLPQPCTRLALHYCEHALQTVRYADYASQDTDKLRLLRVTPLPMPSVASSKLGTAAAAATASSLAPFVDASGTFPKRAAFGLRVDAEVTDADERRALLSGKLRYRDIANLCWVETTVDNGHVIAETHVDALGNTVYQSDRRTGHEIVGRYTWRHRCWGENVFNYNVAHTFAYLAKQCTEQCDAVAAIGAGVVFGTRGRDVSDVDSSTYHVLAHYTAADLVAAARRFDIGALFSDDVNDTIEAIVA